MQISIVKAFELRPSRATVKICDKYPSVIHFGPRNMEPLVHTTDGEAVKTLEFLENLLRTAIYLLYSSDLTSCDLVLCPNVKKLLPGHKF